MRTPPRAGVLVPLAMFVLTSCDRGRDAAPAAPPARDWVEITVDADPHWDAPSIARETRRELDACRQVLEARLGIQMDEARPLSVRLVRSATVALGILDAAASEDRVVSWRGGLSGLAFFRPEGRQVVLYDVEPENRAYVFSFALVALQSRTGLINLTDSVARWAGGMALNMVRGEPYWKRSRLVDGFLQTSVTSKLLEEACLWGSQPLPQYLDLEMGRDPVTWIDGGGIDGPETDTTNRVRRTSWFFVWFLATFAVTPERLVSFDLPPKYEAALREVLARRDSPGREALCKALASREEMVADCSAFMDFVRRKRNLAQVREGVVLAWHEFTNAFGNKSGVPEDDLLR